MNGKGERQSAYDSFKRNMATFTFTIYCYTIKAVIT